MNKIITATKNHVMDNRGDENISKMIWIVITFVTGAILLTLFSTAFGDTVSTWFTNVFNSWFAVGGPAYNGMYPLD